MCLSHMLFPLHVMLHSPLHLVQWSAVSKTQFQSVLLPAFVMAYKLRLAFKVKKYLKNNILWHMTVIWNTDFSVHKLGLIEISILIITYCLQLPCLHYNNREVVKELSPPVKPKILTIWPFSGKVSDTIVTVWMFKLPSIHMLRS